MRGRPYYEEPEYHEYLLSRERRELFAPDVLLSQIRWNNVKDLLDFGMGNGFFLTLFYKYITKETNVWGAECQEELIDYTLSLKLKENLENFIPFYSERTEHPLLPDWIPGMDLIFCSCVLSTFADPALAIRGIGRSLTENGSILILDWEKMEAPSGPEISQKVSADRMKFFISDAGYEISRTLKTSKYLYALEIIRDPEKKEQSPLYTTY